MGLDTDRTPTPTSFLDAAEKLLLESPSSEAIHYVELTRAAIERGYIVTEGRTPEATMTAVIGRDIGRRDSLGESPRFVRIGRGLIGLAEPVPQDLGNRIASHNNEVRSRLLETITSRTAKQFEILVELLLKALGFQDVERTSFGSDSGVDLRGELVVEDAISIKIAVQVKKWTNTNVQRPEIQKLRGSLNAHEQGLIITTSDFSSGARKESMRWDVSPVALVNGEKLVDLLVTKDIGVEKERRNILSLDEASLT